MIYPKCCKEAQEYPSVFFSEEIYGDMEPVGTAYWKVRIASDNLTYSKPTSWWKSRPKAKFCPYCGTALPKMKKRQRKDGDKILKCTDSGYYCDTCGDRLRSCECLPIETLYEEDTTNVA